MWNMKELDKWFEQNREVGAIDDYFRENPNRNWAAFNLKTKIAFYEEFSGSRYIEPKKNNIAKQKGLRRLALFVTSIK